MIDFDCGRLCSPHNEGVPYCCDNETVVPVLFREELMKHKKNGGYWKKMPVKTKADRKMVDELCSYNVYAVCPGSERCIRSKRSIVCMTFPFEPFVDRHGIVQGLVFKIDENNGCPLTRKSTGIFNPEYISSTVTFWQEFLDLLPDEKGLYVQESRRHARRVKRHGHKVRVFVAGNNGRARSFYLKS
jgi:hypothetical protein